MTPTVHTLPPAALHIVETLAMPCIMLVCIRDLNSASCAALVAKLVELQPRTLKVQVPPEAAIFFEPWDLICTCACTYMYVHVHVHVHVSLLCLSQVLSIYHIHVHVHVHVKPLSGVTAHPDVRRVD